MTKKEQELINGYCAGLLNEKEFDELQNLLRSSKEARRLVLEYRSIDSALRSAYEINTFDEIKTSQKRGGLGIDLKPSWQNFILKLAALLVVGFGLIMFFNSKKVIPQVHFLEKTDSGVAIFMRGLDAEFETERYKEGDSIPRGDLKLLKGHVELEFFSGASIILEGPAHLELTSKDGGVLHSGKLRAQVPEHAHGFTIVSSDIELVDLGTSFGMEVSELTGTQVQVFEGEVEIFDPGSKRSSGHGEKLLKGEGRRISLSSGKSSIDLTPDQFLSGIELEKREYDRLALSFQNWLSNSENLSKEKSLLARYDFINEFSKRRTLLNRSLNTNKGINGSIIGAQWSSGRWDQKPSLDFKRPGDRVRITIDETHESMTLATWIRIDGFDNAFSSLMLSDYWGREGAVHWQLMKEGYLELAVFSGLGLNHNSRAEFIVRPYDFGSWVHLVTIYDGPNAKVIHYRDGVEIGVVKLKKVVPLKIGNANLGNWTTNNDKPSSIRNFNGRMDDFSIYSKVLGPEDVNKLYLEGKAR